MENKTLIMTRFIAAYLFLTITTQFLSAQGKWTHYTKENSDIFPPSLELYFEDRDGNLWIGLDYGLYMYDGKLWKRFLKKDGLLNNNITKIYQDIEGTVWIGTEGGISTFKNGILSKTESSFITTYPRAYISCIYEDSKGNMWFGTGRMFPPYTNELNHSQGIIIKYDGTNFAGIDRYSDPPLFNRHPIGEIVEDKNGNIWVTSGWVTSKVFAGHLSMYSGEKWEYCISKIPYNGKWVIDHVYKDRAGDLWFQARSDLKTSCVIQYSDRDLKFHTSTGGFVNYVKKFFEDSKNRLWFGSSRGLVYREDGEFKHLKNENGELIPVNVNEIKEDSENNIWVGTNMGAYVFTGEEWKHFSVENGLSGESNVVKNIAEDFEGKIWLLTTKSSPSKIRYYISKIDPVNWSFETISSNNIYNPEKIFHVLGDSHKNIWFFSAEGTTKYSDNIEN